MNPIDDIDGYFKKTLNNYTQQPSKNGWLELFDQLEKRERRKKSKGIYAKVIGCLLLLLFGLQSTTDEYGVVVEPLADANKNIAQEAIGSTQEPSSNVQEFAGEKKITEKVQKQSEMVWVNEKKTVPPHIIESHDAPIKVDSVQIVGQLGVEKVSKRSNHKIEGLTAMKEIDTLLLMAKIIMDQEQAEHAARKALALKMLNEIENKSNRRFGENVRTGFRKFKAAIAN